MYQDFYQLKENPFNVTADPSFFYPSQSHNEAVINLAYGVEQRKGILVMIGEVGTGKTTICRALQHKLGKRTRFISLISPHLSEIDTLQMIVRGLGIWTRQKSKIGLMQVLYRSLLKHAKQRRTVVLLVDEAQNLSSGQLEQLRLLSNFETEKQKLLQIVLAGQPELEEKLKQNDLRQLRQRVSIYLRLDPLMKADIGTYIDHRIKKATYKHQADNPVTFTDKALDAIYEVTQGTPRKINILCDRALLSGFVTETFLIDDSIIHYCAKEVLYCEHRT